MYLIMKNIEEYYNKENDSYNYSNIVRDYIMEFELYKQTFNSLKFINEISNWFFNQNIDLNEIDNNETDIEDLIISSMIYENAIAEHFHLFVDNHKELFIVNN